MIIKNSKWTVLPVIALMTGATATVSAQDGASALSLPANEFAPMQRFDVNYEEPEDMAEFYVQTLGLSVRDAEFEEGRNPRNRKHKVVIATVEGIDDPKVNAVQWRLEMKAEGGGWEAVSAGLRRKCQNGPNTNQWTRDVCP